MGQWYNIFMWRDDFKEDSIDASPTDAIKLMEFAWTGTEHAKKVMSVLGEKGPFRFLTAGDYAWNGGEGENAEKLKSLGFEEDPYSLKAKGSLEDIGTEGGRYWRYLVNEDKKEYVDLAQAKLPVSWITSRAGFGTPKKADRIHPLFILTAVGNGLGGGDYAGKSDWLAGSWAGDLIGASTRKPRKEYTEFRPDFTESPWLCFDTDKEIREKIDWLVLPEYPDTDWKMMSVEEYLKRSGQIPEDEVRLKGVPESFVRRFEEAFPDADPEDIEAVNSSFSASYNLRELLDIGMAKPLAEKFGSLGNLLCRHTIYVFPKTEDDPDPKRRHLEMMAEELPVLETLADEGDWDGLEKKAAELGFSYHDSPDGSAVVETIRR